MSNSGARFTERRNFLKKVSLAAASTGLTSSLLGQADDRAAELELCRQVYTSARDREYLSDQISVFRQGSLTRMQTVLQQYRDVMEEHRNYPPDRLVALRWMLHHYVLEEKRVVYAKSMRCPHLQNSVTSFAVGNYKCNKLVADAYAHGARTGLSLGEDWTGAGHGTGWPARLSGTDKWPPVANILARRGYNLRSLTDARPLRLSGEEKAQPNLGDVICFPSPGQESGHVGLYLGKNLIVSAKETGIEIGTVEQEQREHGNVVSIRKFNRSGR